MQVVDSAERVHICAVRSVNGRYKRTADLSVIGSVWFLCAVGSSQASSRVDPRNDAIAATEFKGGQPWSGQQHRAEREENNCRACSEIGCRYGRDEKRGQEIAVRKRSTSLMNECSAFMAVLMRVNTVGGRGHIWGENRQALQAVFSARLPAGVSH